MASLKNISIICCVPVTWTPLTSANPARADPGQSEFCGHLLKVSFQIGESIRKNIINRKHHHNIQHILYIACQAYNVSMKKTLNPKPIKKAEINRMTAFFKNPSCPECTADPPVCTQKTESTFFYRCRECGHKWSMPCLSQVGPHYGHR